MTIFEEIEQQLERFQRILDANSREMKAMSLDVRAIHGRYDSEQVHQKELFDQVISAGTLISIPRKN